MVDLKLYCLLYKDTRHGKGKDTFSSGVAKLVSAIDWQSKDLGSNFNPSAPTKKDIRLLR